MSRLLYGPLGGPIEPFALFSPLSLSPFAWYDPSDLSTLFQLSNGTTAVTADGDPVGYMADKSGNGRHLIQATADSRPAYKTSGGLHWLLCDGAADFLAVDHGALAQPVERLTAGLVEAFVLNTARVVGSVLLTLFTDSSSTLGIYSGVAAVTASYTYGQSFVSTERYDGAGSRLAIDNGSYSEGDIGAVGEDILTVAAQAAGDNLVNMRLHGLVQFDRLLTDPEIALLRTYLAAKQGRVL